MKFLPYQKRFIEDKSRLKILVKSRRIGGTFAVSYMVWKRLMETRNHDITVVTADLNLAKEFVLNVTKWVRLWNLSNPQNAVPEDKLHRLDIEIPHADGPTRLLAVSSRANAVIGKGGDLILDEYAIHTDPELLWTLAQPVILAGGNCTILSTQRGRNTKFNEILTEAETNPDSEWSVHRTTFEEAVEEGFLEEIINPKLVKLGNNPFESREDFINWVKRTVSEHAYAQEYMCIPSETATTLLTTEELLNAQTRFKELGNIPNGSYFLGWDIAHSFEGNFATLCVLRAKNSEVDIVETKYFTLGTQIDVQIEEILKLDRKYGFYKIIGDGTGVGAYPCQVLQKKLGEFRVIPYTISSGTKPLLFTKMKRFFENGAVRMIEDEQVENDFLSIERVISPSNKITYEARLSVDGNHGDMSCAFALALSEVPEDFDIFIKGISRNSPKSLEGKQDRPIGRYGEDIEKQNKMNDRKNNKKKSKW